METNKLQKLSVTALIISLLPLATFIPVVLKITLLDGVRSIWAGANIVCALLGLLLSVVCVKNRENRSAVNIVAVIISGFWLLVLLVLVGLALFMNLSC